MFMRRKTRNKKGFNKKKIVNNMEDSEEDDISEDEEEILFMGLESQSQKEESVEGEVDLIVDLISALEELDKCRKKNRYANQIISDLKIKIQEAK